MADQFGPDAVQTRRVGGELDAPPIVYIFCRFSMSTLPCIPLESKLAFLRRPSSYPEPAYRVDAIETHMSWVFLAGDYVYKLKKPVSYEFMDFRTLGARRHFCQEEVRLNRRLAPDVYLGALPLSLDCHARLRLAAGDAEVDWLVKMRRLPACRMLDHLIAQRRARAADFGRVGAALARFYGKCSALSCDPQAYRERMRRQIEANRLEQDALPGHAVEAVCSAQSAALGTLAPVLAERVAQQRLVEGHGDLRPEHICLCPRLAIIDCLEFARALRLLDPADELAFLALECERMGMPDAGEQLFRSYRAVSGDAPAPRLLHFYQSYRASLRATISLRHLQEEQWRHSPQWLLRARQYLDLACAHIAHCR
jgi:aminoglycoside phosphotransferase family enzyme